MQLLSGLVDVVVVGQVDVVVVVVVVACARAWLFGGAMLLLQFG